MDIKIERISIKIGDKELTLSIEEARELMNVLEAAIVPKLPAPTEQHWHFHNDYPYWQPTWVYRQPYIWSGPCWTGTTTWNYTANSVASGGVTYTIGNGMANSASLVDNCYNSLGE